MAGICALTPGHAVVGTAVTWPLVERAAVHLETHLQPAMPAAVPTFDPRAKYRADHSYVLVTAARNEAHNIVRTVESVLGQTVSPHRWVIVDDGSVDQTFELAERASAGHSTVTVVRRPGGTASDFASKVRAVNAGTEAIGDVDHELIGNLDADISVEPTYFERLLERFAARPQLGIGGGLVIEEHNGRAREQRISANSVAGAVQLFRRTCYDQIGGLRPLRLGGEDAAAEILARMHGWEVETFFDLQARHHGRVLNRKRTSVGAWFARGIVNRTLGYDPLFHIAASAYRATQPPYFLGATFMVAGYASAVVRRVPVALPPEAVAFLRAEQRDRLRATLRRQ